MMENTKQQVCSSHQPAVDCQSMESEGKVSEVDYARKPRVDILEREDAYELYLEMPGVEREDLEVVYDQGELSIRGCVPGADTCHELLYRERPWGSFSRTFSIAEGVDPDKITARLEHGVVTIELGKTADVLPRRIEVCTG